jgi:hypothetical protein
MRLIPAQGLANGAIIVRGHENLDMYPSAIEVLHAKGGEILPHAQAASAQKRHPRKSGSGTG